MRDGFKLDVPHKDGCVVAGEPRAFVCEDGLEFGRKKNGHHGGSTMWLRFRCNDPDCPAIALVRWDVVADVIDTGLAAA